MINILSIFKSTTPNTSLFHHFNFPFPFLPLRRSSSNHPPETYATILQRVLSSLCSNQQLLNRNGFGPQLWLETTSQIGQSYMIRYIPIAYSLSWDHPFRNKPFKQQKTIQPTSGTPISIEPSKAFTQNRDINDFHIFNEAIKFINFNLTDDRRHPFLFILRRHNNKIPGKSAI